MLKQPTSRRKSNREQISLNLVPVIDTMVTLIGFMLFTMTFLNLVHIESPFPTASPKVVEEKMKERPLQLTVSLREKDAEVWSPFEKIQRKVIPNVADGQPDIKNIHDTLISVKQKFPAETKVVFVPHAGVNYDVMVAVMDAMRGIDASDPPIFAKNKKTGVDEAVKRLFPDVIFGNLLGGDG
jgi:biopolymer transport protein ExbD